MLCCPRVMDADADGVWLCYRWLTEHCVLLPQGAMKMSWRTAGTLWLRTIRNCHLPNQK